MYSWILNLNVSTIFFVGRCTHWGPLPYEKTTIWYRDLDKKVAEKNCPDFHHWLVVETTHLKNISQIGSFPQVRFFLKNVWNHQLHHKFFGR